MNLTMKDLENFLNSVIGEASVCDESIGTKKSDEVKNPLKESKDIEETKGRKCEISTENHPVYKKGTKGEITDIIMGTEQYVIRLENDGIAYVGIKDINIIEEDNPIILKSLQFGTFKLYKNKVLVLKDSVSGGLELSPLNLDQKDIDFLNNHAIEFPHSVTSILVHQQRLEEAKGYVKIINQQIDEANKEKSRIIEGILGNGGYTYERQ